MTQRVTWLCQIPWALLDLQSFRELSLGASQLCFDVLWSLFRDVTNFTTAIKFCLIVSGGDYPWQFFLAGSGGGPPSHEPQRPRSCFTWLVLWLKVNDLLCLVAYYWEKMARLSCLGMKCFVFFWLPFQSLSVIPFKIGKKHQCLSILYKILLLNIGNSALLINCICSNVPLRF